MQTRIFISYTLQRGFLDINFLRNLQSSLIEHCHPYIDILDNDSIDKQARVEEELIKSAYLILIKTKNIESSDWVKKEILIAKRNNIPILEFDYLSIMKNKFQPITKAICNAWDSGEFNPSSSLQQRQFVFDDLAIKIKT